jgi:phosphonate transport system substrate-binding protein
MKSVARTICSALLLLVSSLGSQAAEAYKPGGIAATERPLILGIHPYSNPQDLFSAYAPIARYVESRVPGLHIQVEASRDYADFEAKLAAGHFDFALPNPYETLLSLDSGYTVIAKMTPDDDFRGLIVARKDKAIRSPKDLAGKTMAFPSVTAVAGTMLPLLYLHQHGVDVAREVTIRYVGSQFSSLLTAFSGEADACGSTVRFWRIWSRDNPAKAAEMEVLWRTEPLPHNGVVARRDVPPDLARRVAAALAGMDKDPSVDQSRFTEDQAHFELATDATYQPMRDFLVRYDQEIGLPSAMKAPAINGTGVKGTGDK